ncbi:hypothetical protein ACI4BF_28995, partial [Klebsiella pneumoniae]|uniref:hypothetical protein n=1 Tax=Klebsiella pneumoniae TaxID=573 RepID=UPI003852D2D4
PAADPNPFPQFPAGTFVVSVKRQREDERSGKRRTVGDLSFYYDGQRLSALSGNVLEPGGPGDNGDAGVIGELRIEAG